MLEFWPSILYLSISNLNFSLADLPKVAFCKLRNFSKSTLQAKINKWINEKKKMKNKNNEISLYVLKLIVHVSW